MFSSCRTPPFRRPAGNRSTTAAREIFEQLVNIPTYGISGLFEDIDDVRAHGKDERLGVSAFYEGRGFLCRLVKEVSR